MCRASRVAYDIPPCLLKRVYNQLNDLIWGNRLPEAKIVLYRNEDMPSCWGFTVDGEPLHRPLIILNPRRRIWKKTLLHEMLHIAEPSLPHTRLFYQLVERYYRLAKCEGIV